MMHKIATSARLFGKPKVHSPLNAIRTLHPTSTLLLFSPSNSCKFPTSSNIPSNLNYFSTLKPKNSFPTTPQWTPFTTKKLLKPEVINQIIRREYTYSVKNEVNPRAFYIMLIVGAILAGIYTFIKEEKKKEFERLSRGKPALGGSFTLVDHNGVPFTDLELSGKFYLIYFGFTFCPDICPTELEKMAKVLDTLEKKNLADGLVPLMISIDPWRDTVGQLREYVAQFHPRLIGATGTPDQVMNCAKKFRVYTSRPPEVNDEEEDQDYLVDHSIFMYLISPSGEFLDFFGQDREEDEITTKILQRFKEEYDRRHPSFFNRSLFYNEKSSN